MTPQRTLLRRTRTPFGSDATFLMQDGVDVESTQNYEIVRRRVFFDDVHFVTLHRERGVAFLIVTGLFGAFLLGIAILIVAIDTDGWPWALPFFTLGAVLIAAFLIRLLMGRDVVTVFGRRSKAVLRFGSFGKEKARAAYGQICAAVRRWQSAMPEPAAETPPPLSPDIPMPPTDLRP